MKQAVFFCSLIFVCLIARGTAFGQQGCEFNIVGTWKAATPNEKNPALYRFSAEGMVTVLAHSGSQGSDLREIASATYELDNPKAPKSITFKAVKGGSVFAEGNTSMAITKYDDTSFISEKTGSAARRWVRVESSRYFLVLAARSGTFYDDSGPAFSMLLKMDGQQTQVEASVGLYAVSGKKAFGTVPAPAYSDFLKEPKAASDVMLRLEVTSAQYDRVAKILGTWERRVREDALLYPQKAMNNILLAKEVVESLNQCSEKIKLYQLDWGLEDDISEHNKPSRVPFIYFKELKRLNESLHISDKKFKEPWQPVSLPPGL